MAPSGPLFRVFFISVYQMSTLTYQVHFRHSRSELDAMDPDDRFMSESSSCSVRSFDRGDAAISFALSRFGHDRAVRIHDRDTDCLVDVISLDLVDEY